MDTFACSEFKFSSDTGQVNGYGAVFNNVDLGQDRIAPGAFSKSLQSKSSLPMLFSHDQAKPVGVWQSLEQDAHGLKVQGRISDTSLGRDVRTLAKDGAVTGLSIGFWPSKADYDGNGVRVLKEVDLVEVSIVTFPMNELARLQTVKSAMDRGEVTRDDFEFWLRWNGLSRRKAKRVRDQGHAGISKSTETAEELNHLAGIIEGKKLWTTK